ncbi:bifunctional DNA primase/polymerase [Kribbella catacumbae]|uniref:bifunctional DNA primase/polymerase n=1 Tax=Kribbella catacumbae TaxID=460086 RepID=UPI00036C6951|nr:bifunctional DNA primase/polymerase [Kribbella catacumbae]
MNDLLNAAHTAAERGWHVFPLIPDDKRPAVEDWENRATLDPARIDKCWSAGPYGVGIACGPSRLVVVDLDQPKPRQTPPEAWQRPGITCGADVLADRAESAGQAYPWNTHTVVTGRGGEHLYFSAPTGTELRNTQARLGWLIDTRAAGGYVVGAGSLAAGRRYRTAHSISPSPLPQWLTDALKPAPMAQAAPIQLDAARRSTYLTAALRAECDHVVNAPAGQHNIALFIAAQNLGRLVAGGALAEADVYAALLTAEHQLAATCSANPPHTERQAHKTIASGLRAGAKRPRTVAA